MTDYYAVLGVGADATEAEIKARYRKLAKENHPDLHPDDKTAGERFKAIGEAFAVLGSPENRAEYDRKRSGNKQGIPDDSRKSPGSGAKATVSKAEYEDLKGRFDSFFGKAVSPKHSGTEKNPLDGSELFERFMGVKIKK